MKVADNPEKEAEMSNDAITTGMKRGLVGGLAGTIIMDLVMAGLFWGVGMPVEMIYSFIR